MAHLDKLEIIEKAGVGGMVRREGGREVGEMHGLVEESSLYFPYIILLWYK